MKYYGIVSAGYYAFYRALTHSRVYLAAFTLLSAFLCTSIVTVSVQAQTKDRRAVLDVQGKVAELTVSPDENIWLVTSYGNTYVTVDAKTELTDWHIDTPLKNLSESIDVKSADLSRITFFNENVAIMTGYIVYVKGESPIHGILRTEDGGHTWQFVEYDFNGTVYSAYAKSTGEAWLTTSAVNQLYYTKDYGNTWTAKRTILKSSSDFEVSSRVFAICMRDSQHGIAGSEIGKAFVTDDNWETATLFLTPRDMSLIPRTQLSSELRRMPRKITIVSTNGVQRMAYWKNYVVIVQDKHAFYAEKNTTQWKAFPSDLIEFGVDARTGTLFGVTKENKIVSHSTPSDFKIIAQLPADEILVDVQAVNGSLYVLGRDNHVFKINGKGLTRFELYTSDHSIPTPEIVKSAGKFAWGLSKNELYVSENGVDDWVREQTLDFNADNFRIVDEQKIILWDGISKSYEYSRGSNNVAEYHQKNPLKNFLSSPLQSISIAISGSGEYQGYSMLLVYNSSSNSDLKSGELVEYNYHPEYTNPFQKTIDKTQIQNVLTEVSASPEAPPRYADFQISGPEIQKYLHMVKTERGNSTRAELADEGARMKKYYPTVPTLLDTLNPHIIKSAIEQSLKPLDKTIEFTQTVKFINQNADTVTVVRSMGTRMALYYIPWTIEYMDQKIVSYNVNLSQSIVSLLPERYVISQFFKGEQLLLMLADYLFSEQNR
ncbi:MAG: hypothetical protein HQ472_06695 [Ignavibacteria bacterium]|nr:hypothetical protein [Ignavibacteria bacterium]